MINRLWHMLVGWGAVGVVYQLTDAFQKPGIMLVPSYIDRAIPFNPAGIWLYLSFFLIIPLAYLTCPVNRLRWLRNSMMVTALLSGVVYMFWPTTMAYPALTQNTLSGRLLTRLADVDSTQNCLPSLHMALTVLSVWAVSSSNRWKTGIYVLWSLAIAFSILQLRRHLFVDLISGTALALGVGALLWRLRFVSRSGQKESAHG
ncbi:inositol phosphorylceramide synthase [Enterobacteriaceae bacterium Kacie_13]|nr:inositol phosphorylceramide synthase [Enterobacteriaceae bacterium Kacie_13]